MSGLRLTPQCASGIAAFYHSARFVGWLAQLDEPEIWVCSAQKLDQPSNLVAPDHTHNMLLQEFIGNCAEGAQDPPGDAAAGDDANERPRPAALPLLPLNKHASQQLREMKERQAIFRNSAASQRRSCAIGRSTRPSKTSSPAPVLTTL